MAGFKDRACIAGIGETQYSRNSGKTELGLMLEASLKAIADAGLKPHDIEGVIPPRLYATAEHSAANPGIEDLRYAVTVCMGGASPVAALQSAALAVSSALPTTYCVADSASVFKAGASGIAPAVSIGSAPERMTLPLAWLKATASMVSWIIDVPAQELRLDLPVIVVFEDFTPEVTLPKFRRA